MTQHIYHTVVKTTWQHRRQHDSTITGMTRHLHHTTAIKNELTLDCLHACMDSDREWWVPSLLGEILSFSSWLVSVWQENMQ
jgi:hypothetical protein